MRSLKELIYVSNIGYLPMNEMLKKEVQNVKCGENTILATVHGSHTKQQRECDIGWIAPVPGNFIPVFLERIVRDVNTRMNWNYELDTWQCSIQYTRYTRPQDHYDWHVDILNPDEPQRGGERKVSIVYCLTDQSEYEGADLQFLINGQISGIKLTAGDFAVFPSFVKHRVTGLESGLRETLVGWYR